MKKSSEKLSSVRYPSLALQFIMLNSPILFGINLIKGD